MPETHYLTTSQVAAAKDVNVRTVARWVEAGHLTPAMRLPGDTGAMLFDPNDVEALDAYAIAKRRTNTGDAA